MKIKLDRTAQAIILGTLAYAATFGALCLVATYIR